MLVGMCCAAGAGVAAIAVPGGSGFVCGQSTCPDLALATMQVSKHGPPHHQAVLWHATM